MGRKKVRELKARECRGVLIRLTPDIHAALKEQARAQGLSMARFAERPILALIGRGAKAT
jgi:predicted HicB family RNase H-like nuclease